MRRQTFLAAILFVTTAGFASGEHSASQCASAITPIGAGDAMLYLIDDPQNGIWLYQETNGHAWVQRGGAAWYEIGTGGGSFDWCWDLERETGWVIENPDFIVV